MSVAGKIALVTGAAQGLGKAFTKVLLQNGAKVCMCDIKEEEGKLTLDEFQISFGKESVIFQKTDVTSHEQMEEAFQLVKDVFGGLDIVVNNAGIGGEVYPLWEKVVDVNLKGTICGTMLALESMRRDKGGNGGVIINISSMAGLFPNPFGPVYTATKFAVIGFSKSWSSNPDCYNNGVRINVVCPSFVDTDMVSGLNDDNCLNMAAAHSLKKTFGIMTTEYVAEGVLELIEDETKNGAILKMRKYEGKEYDV